MSIGLSPFCGDASMETRSRQHGFTVIELLINATVISTLAAISLPSYTTALANQRLSGDATNINSQLAVVRMRSASLFTRGRLTINPSAGTYQSEIYNKTTNSWVLEGGTQRLASGISFSYGSIHIPAGSQVPIAQSTTILFNSRGIPIDNSGTPTGNRAVYITDGSGHYRAITVSASSLTNIWRYQAPAWVKLF
jgi:Tfp pilus assembly protein FimT